MTCENQCINAPEDKETQENTCAHDLEQHAIFSMVWFHYNYPEKSIVFHAAVI